MGALIPAVPSGETIYGKLKRLYNKARRGNPHLIDPATGLPGLLPASQAPTVNVATGWVNNAAVTSAGYSTRYQLINNQSRYYASGGWLYSAGQYVQYPAVTASWTGSGIPGNVASNPARNAISFRISFVTDADAFVVSCYGAALRFMINGQYVSLAQTGPTARVPDYVLVDFTGVGGRQEREIIIEATGNELIESIYVKPSYTIWAPSSQDRLRAIFYGDSITTGSNAAILADAFEFVAADNLGISDAWGCGIGGTGYGNNAGGLYYAAQDHVFDITNNNPDLVFLTHNVNSYNLLGWAGTQPYFMSVYQQIRAWSGTVPVFQMGVLGSVDEASTVAYENGQKSFISTLQATDPNLFFMPVVTDPAGSWITGLGNSTAPTGVGNRDFYYSQGGPHPQTVGHQYLGLRFAKGAMSAITQKA